MNVFIWLEKYGLLLMLLFCLGVFAPDFSNKMSAVDHELDVITNNLTKSNTFKQVFWIFVFMFFSFRFFINTEINKLKPIITYKIFILMVICVVALLSASWSNYPFVSMKRAMFQVLFCTSLSLGLCFAYFHKSIEFNLSGAIVICILMVILAMIQGVGLNESFQLAGYAKSKNTMGINLAVLIVISHMWTKSFDINSKLLNIMLVALFVLLLLTQSKTSIALCILYLLMTRLSLFKIKVITCSLVILFFSIFILIPGVSYHINDYQHIALYVDDDFFTGRGIIWDALYYDLGFFDEITLGYGYGSYFGVGVIPFVLDDKYSFLQYVSSAHNGYLQLLLQFGVVGSLFIFIFFIVSMLNSNNKYLHAALIIPILHNVTESSIFRDVNMAWFLMVVIIISSGIYLVRYEVSNERDIINGNV
ncbi:MAG: O-antigen ligase family protein [Moritella sp.]|uniref:O-antigen ligase family protein n=1 Tax=Moritella sp. TaxID=78556 RepID=UPI0025F50888|nr:O-antigen ligase family protein [Moritella sp.]NQZ91924.1 O-antigen ligase family protein [Moritella sp.]